MFTVATWNVNSIKVRHDQLIDWLKTDRPDVVCLQELKSETKTVPVDAIEELGYNIAIHGQKTYNGVAILSKFPISEVKTTFPDDPKPEQARYLEAEISLPNKAVRVISLYVPNGGEPDSDKFQYKLQFLDALYAHLKTLLQYREMLVIGGDYNVAPDNIDVFDPVSLLGSTCFHPEEQKRFRKIINLGLVDAYRLIHPETQEFSWWDYRGGSWQHNKGMRIDHLLLSPESSDVLNNVHIHTKMRGLEKASDHVPVVARFE